MNESTQIPIVCGETYEDINNPIYLNKNYVVLEVSPNKLRSVGISPEILKHIKLQVGDILRFEYDDPEAPTMTVLRVGYVGQPPLDSPEFLLDNLNARAMYFFFSRYASNRFGVCYIGNEEDYKAVLQGVPVDDILA